MAQRRKNAERRPTAAQRAAWMKKYAALTGYPQPKPHDYWDTATYLFLSGKTPEEAAERFNARRNPRSRKNSKMTEVYFFDGLARRDGQYYEVNERRTIEMFGLTPDEMDDESTMMSESDWRYLRPVEYAEMASATDETAHYRNPKRRKNTKFSVGDKVKLSATAMRLFKGRDYTDSRGKPYDASYTGSIKYIEGNGYWVRRPGRPHTDLDYFREVDLVAAGSSPKRRKNIMSATAGSYDDYGSSHPPRSYKRDRNPYSKRYTLKTFSEKYWGQWYPEVNRTTRMQFWDDFKYAYSGGLARYKKETRG